MGGAWGWGWARRVPKGPPGPACRGSFSVKPRVALMCGSGTCEAGAVEGRALADSCLSELGPSRPGPSLLSVSAAVRSE